MTWTPPTSKWKTAVWVPDTCLPDDVCEVYVRYDTLASVRVHTLVGFERVCTAHAHPDAEIGVIRNFDGEWMESGPHEAWETSFFSHCVVHEAEAAGRRDLEEVRAKELAFTQNQIAMHLFVRRAETLPTPEERARLLSLTDDAGPLKLRSAIRTLPVQVSDAIQTVGDWNMKDNRLRSRAIVEIASELGIPLSRDPSVPFDQPTAEGVDWWFEGLGGDRVLHVDTDGLMPTARRGRVDAAVALSFGSGRLVWEG